MGENTPAARQRPPSPEASPAQHDPGQLADDPATSLRAVGGELRRIRRNSGLSLRDLGRRAGLTPGFLSLVERGECSLSLTSLFALARALDVPAADLIQGGLQQARRTDFAVWPGHGDPEGRVVLGEREYWQLHAAFPGRQLEPLLMRIQPTRTPAAPATHDGEEFVYIVSGRLSITLREEKISLEPGHAVHFKSDVPHAICNRTDAAVLALWVVTANFSEHLASRGQH